MFSFLVISLNSTAGPGTREVRGTCLARGAGFVDDVWQERRRLKAELGARDKQVERLRAREGVAPRGGESSGGPRRRVFGGRSTGAGECEARHKGGHGCEYEVRHGGAAVKAR